MYFSTFYGFQTKDNVREVSSSAQVLCLPKSYCFYERLDVFDNH